MAGGRGAQEDGGQPDPEFGGGPQPRAGRDQIGHHRPLAVIAPVEAPRPFPVVRLVRRQGPAAAADHPEVQEGQDQEPAEGQSAIRLTRTPSGRRCARSGHGAGGFRQTAGTHTPSALPGGRGVRGLQLPVLGDHLGGQVRPVGAERRGGAGRRSGRGSGRPAARRSARRPSRWPRWRPECRRASARWTSRASRPCRVPPSIGTPTTGRIVWAATTPARCAARAGPGDEDAQAAPVGLPRKAWPPGPVSGARRRRASRSRS